MSLSLASSFEDFMLNIKSLLVINKAYRDYLIEYDKFMSDSSGFDTILSTYYGKGGGFEGR